MMKKILTGVVAALTIGGALAASAVPASAEPHGDRGWHGGGGWRGEGGWRGDGGRWRGYGWGGPAAAGLFGLGVGAALAGAYAPYPAYYYGPVCRIEMRWNPYWGGYERVRVCY